MKGKICIFALLLAFTSGCIDLDNPRRGRDATLTVFAAASLSEAFTEIAAEFEASPSGGQVAINFAGSQQLAQQISHGAMADIFASADSQQMDNVIITGQVAAGTDQPFIHNQLAVVLPPDNPAAISAFGDLARPGVQLLLADPAVPVGRYSQELLARASQQPGFGSEFKDRVLANVVSHEENVRAVLTKIILGEADAGIVYLSDFIGARDERILMIPIPDEVNVTASYYIAPLTDSFNREQGLDFLNMIFSPQGQEILMRYGFNPRGADE